MRPALAAQPGHAAATADLGGLLRITGHHETSDAMLRAALHRDPDNAGAPLNLVAELLPRSAPPTRWRCSTRRRRPTARRPRDTAICNAPSLWRR